MPFIRRNTYAKLVFCKTSMDLLPKIPVTTDGMVKRIKALPLLLKRDSFLSYRTALHAKQYNIISLQKKEKNNKQIT